MEIQKPTVADLTNMTHNHTSNATGGAISVPVKASGSDIDTGTDDAKFVTAKAIKDSKNVPDVAPGTSGNVVTSDGTNWTSAAASAGTDFLGAQVFF